MFRTSMSAGTLIEWNWPLVLRIRAEIARYNPSNSNRLSFMHGWLTTRPGNMVLATNLTNLTRATCQLVSDYLMTWDCIHQPVVRGGIFAQLYQ